MTTFSAIDHPEGNGMLSTIETEARPELLEHELVNNRGDTVRLLNYGARISSIKLSLYRESREIVLGCPEARDYLGDPWYLGCTIGRYCNRIRDSRFVINGKTCRLSRNHGAHHLHGGNAGFDKRFWSISGRSNAMTVCFSLSSEDGDQGYPGNLSAVVEYAWNDERELRVTYIAETDQATHLNLTNHAYFNLNGRNSDILGHRIRINSDAVTDVDEDMLPTGQLLDVRGSELDLRRGQRVDSLLASTHPLVARANGADFNYVLSAGTAAELWNNERDLKLAVQTSYPGLQFYSGQHLAAPFRRHGGLCLEPQYFPDSPNQSTFPTTLLNPGERYLETIRYSFTESR